MKKIKLSRFAKLNGRMTILTNIVTILITFGYTCAIFMVSDDVIRTTLIMMGVPILTLLVTLQYTISHRMNNEIVDKYNNQQIQDSRKLEEMFLSRDISDINSVKQLSDDMSTITSLYNNHQ